ncbi:OmpA family protein [Pelagerythrobacter marinus]|jgi:OOP family OmpA-OmpF porin|uniref:OmpA family protein n=1 Tax=Pelagerythrobacter marinus TaxID=538382 RepID=UPI002037665C|nr:OmpA family protein [Pelagerythrobacter marinus]USA38655.1 OmpA family protein [Pelagerythrobacter marinus]WPZ07318.1 OmpA family protein [Pelagerythrobacter marinus]
MPFRPIIAIVAGALATAAMALAGATMSAHEIQAGLERQAAAAIARNGGTGVTAHFTSPSGWPSRHPVLESRGGLDEGTRAEVARAVAEIPGIGGVRWADGEARAQVEGIEYTPMHCQEDVDALLRARTVRFEQSRSTIDRASQQLLDEVAAALRPCLGSIIAITGHTDSSGTEPGNLALSRERAEAVRQALIARGIPGDGLRARGVGSSEPVEGLAPADPANRRIEFSVIATEPLEIAPVDVPGAR